MIQMKVFTPEQESELNEFLKTASLWDENAIRVSEGKVFVMYEDSPGEVPAFELTDALKNEIKKIKKDLFKNEAESRIWEWRKNNVEQEVENVKVAINKAEGKEKYELQKELKDLEERLENVRKQNESFAQRGKDTLKDIETYTQFLGQIERKEFSV